MPNRTATQMLQTIARCSRLDSYVLTELGKRLAVALLIVLAALVIERVLRLFDIVSTAGGPVDLVWRMAAMLVPHYLGLALPAAFFVSIYLTVSRFHNDSEFDAILASGIAPERFSRPLIGAAFGLAIVSFGVFGYLQPYARYGYRSLYYIATHIPWDTRLLERVFSRVEHGTIVSADRIDPDGTMNHVFIQYKDGNADVVITAMTAFLEFGPEREIYRLYLLSAEQIVSRPDSTPIVGYFDTLTVRRQRDTTLEPFRPRGDDVREMTMGELTSSPPPAAGWNRSQARAEFHVRLVRAVSVVFLPMLAIPLAFSGRRLRSSAGLVFGALLLVIYHYIVQTLQGIVALGLASPGVLWGGALLFAVASSALFWRFSRHPGASPLEPALVAIQGACDWGLARLRRGRRA